MNPWDIAAWAGAIAVTALCGLVVYSAITTITKRTKSDNSRN